MKRIIICADGTWNTPDQVDRNKRKPSNVVKTARAILPITHDGIPQIVYYQVGLGTHNSLSDRMLGGGMGKGLSDNIINCYRFLVHNYYPGDEVFLFGFSRGAYTVRSLSGFIGALGLLPKANIFFMNEAYDAYRNSTKNPQQLDTFRKEQESREIKIKFIGVWDTVGALGIPKVGFGMMHNIFSKSRNEFHNVALGDHIENAFHALAIDEKRKPFAPTLWEIKNNSTQKLEQTWFPGVHTNIGGGYLKDGLANISFQWMKEKAETQGLRFDKAYTKFFKPYFGHELRNNFTMTYKLLGANYREIGRKKNTNENVHKSAFLRYKHDETYRPINLIQYMEREGIVIE